MNLETQLQEQKRLLEIFPNRGRDTRATKALAARRAAIQQRIAALESRLAETRRAEWLQVLEQQKRLQRELAVAPRCVLVGAHTDEDGEPVDPNDVLAKYVGGLQPESPLVIFRDYGGSGAWVPRYEYPAYDQSQVPTEIAAELQRQWEREYGEWREFTRSLRRVEITRSYSYFGDDDSLKYGEETITKWLTPDGRELPYPPFEPRSLADRLKDWWWAHVVGPQKPQIEAEWRARAIDLLAQHGWEVRF